MIKVTNAEIVALLQRRPGLTFREIREHFKLTSAFTRLIKLAAQHVIRSETVSLSVRADGRTTTGAQVRRYFAPVAW
jgi:hypothetical protein